MEPSNENSKGRKINILSLDGGGIRGLSSLIVLKHLSFRCKKPLHEIFDLICGTSTGGIIAIMLGILKMDIDECIKLYMEMGAKVFEKIPRMDPTVESWENLFVPKERYSDRIWESVIKATLQKKINPEKFMKEKGEEPMPKVFVVAQRKEGKRHLPYCFRNYDVFPDDTAGTSKIKIWQAARATSAVPFYFSAVEIDGFHYIDGSIGDNNPTILAYDVEAFNAFPGCEVNAIISVGTGLPSFQVDNGSVEDLISRVLLVSLDTEVLFNRFEISLRNHGKTDMLYRFNVEDIGDIVE